MLNEGQVAQMGLIESLKNSMSPDVIAHKIGIDKNMLIDIGIYGVIGFITGFLLKKYSEYFIALVFLVIAMVVLQQLDYISLSFNTAKIYDVLGIRLAPIAGNAYGSLALELIKSNIPGMASLVGGLLIGLKVG
jgi:uncharacterized membrane protein (Fun14 family)